MNAGYFGYVTSENNNLLVVLSTITILSAVGDKILLSVPVQEVVIYIIAIYNFPTILKTSYFSLLFH